MNRKVIIVDSNSASKIELEGDYTTFGDILNAARANGMNVENKDWKDGISRAEYTSSSDPNSVLPTNMTFRGVTTNNMVFRVTTTSKQISSGICGVREDFYNTIKNTEGLASFIKEAAHKSYTNCTTELLSNLIDQYYRATVPTTNKSVHGTEAIVEAIAKMLVSLPEEVYNQVMATVEDTKNFTLSDDDIEALFI